MFHGVVTWQCTQVTAQRNTITGRGNVGTNPAIGGIGMDFIQSDHVDAIQNHLSQISDSGIKAQGCSYVNYFRNYVENVGKDGLKIDGDPTPYNTPGFARVVGNTVRYINAWRTDGSSLILVADVDRAYVSGNIVQGGGTRVADAVRCALVQNTSMARQLIVDNIGTGIDGRGLYASGTVVDLTVRGNRWDGNIQINTVVNGDCEVINNVINNGGTTNTSVYAIDVSGVAKTLTVRGNTLSEHLGGFTITPVTAGAVSTIRVVDNTIRDCYQWGGRIDNYAAAAAIGVVEVGRNTFYNTTAGVANTSVIRVGVTNLTIAVLRVAENTIRMVGANAATYWLEFTGTTGVGLADVRNNDISGITNEYTISTPACAARYVGLRQTVAPTFGTWARDDAVDCTGRSEAGTTPNKYVVTGFTCTVAGSPGTWVAMRSLTGN